MRAMTLLRLRSPRTHLDFRGFRRSVQAMRPVGAARRHVERLQVVLADGSVLDVGRESVAQQFTGEPTRRDHLVEAVCILIKKHNMQKRVMFSSFLSANLSKAQSYLPDVPRGLLALPSILGTWARSFGFAFGKYQALHPFLKDMTQQQVARVHRLNRRVHVWTVNDERDMRRLFAWGVDGIFTDDPQLARRVRAEST